MKADAQRIGAEWIAFLDRHRVAATIAVFTLLAAFVLPTCHMYHGDEHFYTDSALSMMRSGNYLTPVYADGSLRFRKPILTYWVVVAGFRIFGIGHGAARAGSLAAGCLLLGLTYRLGLALFRDRAAAWLGMLTLASTILFFEGATRINPDMLLAFFVTMSLLGFSRIVLGEDRRTRDCFLAYLGAGLALETKGMLGLLCVAYPVVFCLFLPDRWSRLRRLVHLPAMLAGAAVGLAWFAYIGAAHGWEAWDTFVADQITTRLPAVGRSHPLANLFGYLGGILVTLFPWWLFLPVRRESAGSSRVPPGHGRAIAFALGWGLLILLIMSAGNLARGRYLLPAYPWLCATLGFLLHRRFRTGQRIPALRIVLWGVAGLTAVGGVALLALGERLLAGCVAPGIVLLAAALPAGLAARWASPWPQAAMLFVLTVTLYVVSNALLRPMLGCTPTAAIADRIRAIEPPPKLVLAVAMPEKYASQIRVLLADSVPVQTRQMTRRVPPVDVLVFSESVRPSLKLRDYAVEPAGYEYPVLGMKELREVFAAPDWAAAVDRLKIPYYVARRRLGANPETRALTDTVPVPAARE